MGRLFSVQPPALKQEAITRQVLPLSSDRQTPCFFGSGVGETAGVGDPVGVGVGVGGPVCSSPPVPVLAPTSICAYSTFGFARETSLPIRPRIPSRKSLP